METLSCQSSGAALAVAVVAKAEVVADQPLLPALYDCATLGAFAVVPQVQMALVSPNVGTYEQAATDNERRKYGGKGDERNNRRQKVEGKGSSW